MQFKSLPIKRKMMLVIMLTSITALVLTAASFIAYDLVTFRQSLARNLGSISTIIAENSTGALLFDDEELATRNLAEFKVDRHVRIAALYDVQGNLYARYPTNAPASEFPPSPGAVGVYFENGRLIVVRQAVEDDKFAGTLYVESTLGAVYQRLRLYGGLAALIILGSALVALGISSALQRRVTDPILALVHSARMVSDRVDLSVRAPKTSADELGLLTDAFNLMMARVEAQTTTLRESEARKSAILQSAIDCVITMDQAGRIVDFNPAAETTFGYRREQVIGKTVAEIIVPERLRAAHIEGLARFMATGHGPVLGRRIELPALRADGSEFPAELAISSMPLEGGGFFFTAYLRDITERQRTEEARSLLAAIVQSSDDAIVGKDLESRVVSWNIGAERMFGYTAAEMIGQPITRLLSPDRPGEEAGLIEEAKRGEIRHFETIRIHKDGHPIDVSLTISPIKNAKGEIVGVSSIARDITERKRAEEALERHASVLREQAQMLDLANVMARDLNNRVILWNSGMEKMYGWTKEEALGQNSHELLRTRFPEPLDSIMAALHREGRWEGELIHFDKGGRQLVVASQWVLHKDPQGKPAAILEVNNDITERKQAEEQIRQMNVELEQRVQDRTSELTAANQEMEAFTYSVAHDLRAPLRHIDAFSRILAEDFASSLPPEARRYLEHIRGGSRNMSQLVDDLLNLARVGRQELRRKPTPLGPIVNEVVADLRREAEGRHIEWHIRQLPTVECDSGLMKQVFANLLSNAVKYTRPRQKAVIEVGSVKANGGNAIFVRDNGVGFNMKYVDKLFGVFQRLHRAEEFEGTGVGLATVDRIVRKHGGSIWAEASLNQGATFYFTVAGLQDSNHQK
jgi:PAS domain S-box-containing protein